MWHKKKLNNKGLKIEPCGTPNKISLHQLYLSLFLFFIFYLRRNYLLIFRRFCQNHTHPVWQFNR